MSADTYNPLIGLHPEIVGSSTILNNGVTPNTLHFGITNNNLFGASNPDQVDISITTDTKIYVWFIVDDKQASSKDPDREWALTSYADFHNVAVKVNVILPNGKDDTHNWAITRNKPSALSGVNPTLTASLDGWEFIPKRDAKINPGGTLQVQISGLVTGLPDGPTVGYFSWQSSAGGTMLTFGPMHKTPHVLRGEKVGIGTNIPGVSLDVRGGIRANGGAPGSLGANNTGYFFNPPGDNDSGMSSSAQGQLEFYVNSREAMRIMDKDGVKVGIGTKTPNALLQIGDQLVENENWFSGKSRYPQVWITQKDDSTTDIGSPCLDLRNSSKAAGTGSMLSFSSMATNNSYGQVGGAIRCIFEKKDIRQLSGDLAFYTNTFDNEFNEHLRITSEGNVGIGTPTPGVKADIRGGVASDSFFGFSSVQQATSPYTVFMSAPEGNVLGFYTNGQEQLRINGNGQVGIGTNNPSATLEVNGDVKVNGNMWGTFAHFIKRVTLDSGNQSDTRDQVYDLTQYGVPKGANAVILQGVGGTSGDHGAAGINIFPPAHPNDNNYVYTLAFADQSGFKGDVGRAFNQGAYPIYDGKIYVNVNNGWDFGWNIYIMGWYGPPS